MQLTSCYFRSPAARSIAASLLLCCWWQRCATRCHGSCTCCSSTGSAGLLTCAFWAVADGLLGSDILMWLYAECTSFVSVFRLPVRESNSGNIFSISTFFMIWCSGCPEWFRESCSGDDDVDKARVSIFGANTIFEHCIGVWSLEVMRLIFAYCLIDIYTWLTFPDKIIDYEQDSKLCDDEVDGLILRRLNIDLKRIQVCAIQDKLVILQRSFCTYSAEFWILLLYDCTLKIDRYKIAEYEN